MARTIDGTFDVVGSTFHLLSAPAHTLDDLQRLERILREAQEAGESPEAVEERVEREAPQLLPTIRALLASRDARMEVATWIGIALMVLTLMQQRKEAGGDVHLETNPGQVVEQVDETPSGGPHPPPPAVQEEEGGEQEERKD